MRPDLSPIGRVVIRPYDTARFLLIFADQSIDPDEFRALKQRLPEGLREQWNYWELPRPRAWKKRYNRLIIHTRVWKEPLPRKVHTLLRYMVRDRLIDKLGEAMVPCYWQVPAAFTGFVLNLYFVLGVKLGTLIRIFTRWTPAAFSSAYDMASLNTPRGP